MADDDVSEPFDKTRRQIVDEAVSAFKADVQRIMTSPPKCERCGGSGKVWSFVYRSTLIKCPKCSGTGKAKERREGEAG